MMKNSLKSELLALLIDTVQNLDESTDWEDELHNIAFNEDYYVIGYYDAERWLNKHGISAWDCISVVLEWERNVLGEVQLKVEDINPEHMVNLYVYVRGEELLSDYDLCSTGTTKQDLLDEFKQSWKELN